MSADPAVPAANAPRRGRLLRSGLQTLGIGAFYILIVIFFSIASPVFPTVSNLVNVLSNISVIGIVALGQAIAIISGGFDLSVSGAVPLGAVLYSLLSNAGFATPLAMLAVVLAGVTLGLINGMIVTRIGINPLITTLGTLSISVGLAYSLSSGVTIPLSNMAAGALADPAFAGIPWYLIAFLVLAGLALLVLRFTIAGRMIYAIGGNREASRLAGLRVDLVTVLVYAQCGGLAAFAGVVVTSQLLAGSATVGSDTSLTSIAAVVLGGASLTGGIGGIGGTLIGVLVLGTIANGMVLLQVPAFYQQIATGAILLLGVGFARLREIVGNDDA